MAGHGRGRGRRHTPNLGERADDPRIRLRDVRGAEAFRALHELDPDASEITEYLERVVACQTAKAAGAAGDDPFYETAPPAGTFANVDASGIPLGTLLTGDVICISLRALMQNLIVCGPAGGGKTSWARVLLLRLLIGGESTVVAFEKKGDLVGECEALARDECAIALHWSELMLSLFQAPPGVDPGSFVAGVVELLRRYCRLEASGRLLLEAACAVLEKPRPEATWPTLSELITYLKGYKARGFRASQYREAAIFALQGIALTLGRVLDYARSDVIERILNHRGLIAINTGGLPDHVASLLASLIIHYCYEWRGVPGVLGNAHPVLFAFDDATGLVHGEQYREAADGTNPIAAWSMLGRSRLTGLLVSSQDFSLISPALRNNTDTVVVCGSYGRDAHELGVHLDLNREQVAFLGALRPGQVVLQARSVWPHAVHAQVPYLP